MGKYVTVSVKIPEETKKRLERLGTKPSALMKKAIEETLRQEEIKEIKTQIKKMKTILAKIDIKDVVKSIREDRDSR